MDKSEIRVPLTTHTLRSFHVLVQSKAYIFCFVLTKTCRKATQLAAG
ncbi:hypothetical protein KGY63_03675 [Candidatus Bipolaricaulota bacterium]|nr:hypothetical protein [Candidatus Bipolaricaulota bacterium]